MSRHRSGISVLPSFAGSRALPASCCAFLSLTVGAQTQSSLATAYSLQTLAGSDFAGDGGLATSALLTQIEGVACDARGNIYIADAANHRVRRITTAGIISTVAGNGHPGFSGDGGPAANAQLRTPYGLAVDRSGNIYIADLGNARIRRITPDGVITTFAGGGATAPALADGHPATDVVLNSPRNVASDYYGTVFFSDFGGHRVFQVSTTGTLNLFAGTGAAGYSGDSGSAISAQLSSPAGLAVDASGAVYVADSGNGSIRKIVRGIISTLGDGGKAGAQSSVPIVLPTGLAMDPDGSLFVADAGGNQLLRITPALATTPIAQPARDIAIDAQGNLYACTGGLVYRRPRLGGVSVVAGGSAPNYLGDGGPLWNAQFNRPGAIARDSAGNLYIADTGHHSIRKIISNGSILTVAGNGAQGFSGDGGAATAARLDSPVGVALDAAGNLYIGDSGNHRVRKVDGGGVISTIAGTGVRGHSVDGTVAVRAQLDTPTWLALDGNGVLYFSETGGHAVRKIASNGQLGTLAGTGVRGFTGDGAAAISATLDSPQGLAIDSAGNIYIADAGNHRIRYVVAPSTFGSSMISTVPDPSAAIWRNLRGLAIDAQGSLFICDADDQRVFRMDPPGRVLTIAGTGIAAYTGETGDGLGVALDTPTGIAQDQSGTVYVSDSGNARIRKLLPSLDSVVTAPAQPPIAVLNAAGLQGGPIAPGELVSIFGAGLGAETGVSAPQAVLEIGGTQVLFNGRLAPLFYAGPNQINLQVPYSLGDTRPCDVQVLSNGIVKARASVNIADAAPAIFTGNGGTGPAAALNEDGSLNSSVNPAARGSIIVLFATGEGQTNPAGLEGRAAGFPGPVPLLPVSLKIGTYDADILYAGAAPGFSGLLQVNARIPGGFAPPGILAVTLQVGSAVSPPGVTVAVR